MKKLFAFLTYSIIVFHVNANLKDIMNFISCVKINDK